MAPRTRLLGQPISIALRLTVWYALSAFVLIFVATGVLYWVLVNNLEREDTRILEDNLNNVRLLLQSSSSTPLPARGDRGPAWPAEPKSQVYFRILDEGARTVVETPGISRELPTPTVAGLTAITSKVSHQVVSRSGQRFLVLTARLTGDEPASPARYVQVAIDRRSEDHLLARYREWLWLVLILSVIICSLAGYVIARGGMRPIERIGQTAERVGSTTLHERIDTPGLPAELCGLAETFNGMLDRLQESFTRVSQFSDDVAHELRTPINNLRGEIEVALSRGRSNDDYREVLGSCLEECTRISRVIQSLLFLARAENTTEPLQRETVDVGRELTAVREFYEAAAAEAGVDLRVAATPGLWAPLHRTLFQQVVGNLVSNAIAHTPKNGTVEVMACVDAAWLSVTVKDTGRGIAEQHLPHVFNRFYRIDWTRSGASHNVGLGLAVVKSVVERHAGTIEIDSEVGRGTQVRLTFPRHG